jgi:methylmalonyl-CoA mutase
MSLFKDFQAVTSKQWKQKIQMDLKGADYNDLLIAKTNEGIDIKPFYHKDNFQSLEIPNLNTSFKICQSVFIDDEKIAANIANDAVDKGANNIQFIVKKPFNISVLLSELKKETKVNCLFKIEFLEGQFINKLVKVLKETDCKFEIDIIGNFVKTGNWFISQQPDFKIISKLNSNFSIGIDASIYQNAGANMIQQIAYALAHINEYLNENNITSATIINCNMSVGSHYFFEIAKLRAFRYLFKKLTEEYKIKPKLNLIVQPTLRNKTIFDFNINMLRTTTECMSAILGGASIINTVAYDSLYHKSNKFGERIARNQLIILQEESYFNEASQIANGAYYIEQLTFEMANKSLKLFKDIENKNGFLEQLKSGTIQRKIEESAKKEQQQFDNKEIILVGTNKYQNKNDKMKDDLQLYPFIKQKPRKTIIKPIISRRLSEKLELERLKQE